MSQQKRESLRKTITGVQMNIRKRKALTPMMSKVKAMMIYGRNMTMMKTVAETIMKNMSTQVLILQCKT